MLRGGQGDGDIGKSRVESVWKVTDLCCYHQRLFLKYELRTSRIRGSRAEIRVYAIRLLVAAAWPELPIRPPRKSLSSLEELRTARQLTLVQRFSSLLASLSTFKTPVWPHIFSTRSRELLTLRTTGFEGYYLLDTSTMAPSSNPTGFDIKEFTRASTSQQWRSKDPWAKAYDLS